MNLHVKEGRIYGLLGRNGAGKTTIMKMILGLTPITSGNIEVFGKNIKGLEKLKTNFDFSRQHNYNFYLATASISEEIDFCTSKYQLPFHFYAADDIMLKTIVRSNPGLVLIKDGTIIKKWHHNDFPNKEELQQLTSN